MGLADVKSKTTFNGYNAADESAISGVIDTAYIGSATFKSMVDNWLAVSGHTINFQYVAGALYASNPLTTGNMSVDVNAVNNLLYIDNTGTADKVTLAVAVIHELGHALTGRKDNYDITTPDYNGDNDIFINHIYDDLGIPDRNSYISVGSTTQLMSGYAYTNGATIDDSVLVGQRYAYSPGGNFNSDNKANTKDLLIGDPNANILITGGGDDFLFGGGGDDRLKGGAGTDTAIYLDNNPADYDIRRQTDGSWTVNDVRGSKTEGKDTLQNVEILQFDKTQHFNLTAGGLTFETDLVLVIDTTGSMGPYIAGIQAQAKAIIAALFADGKTDARIAIESFKDTSNGEPSATILKFTDQDSFADRQSAAIAAINTLSAAGGGDIPETDNDGLIHALNGDVGLWRSGAASKRIVLFTDAPIKDTALNGQVAALIANPASDGPLVSHFAPTASSADAASSSSSATTAKFSDDPADPDNNSSSPPPFVDTADPVTSPAGTTPSVLFAIQVGTDSTATASLKTLATVTGGTYLNAPTPSDLTAALLNIVQLPAPASYSISASDADKAEGNSGVTPFTFFVTRTGNASAPATLTYTVSGVGLQPATADDFSNGVFPSGQVSFAAGDTSETITIGVNGDTAAELDERFAVSLGASASVVITTGIATGIIRNDDTSPTSLGTGSAPGISTATVGVPIFRFFDSHTGAEFLTSSSGERADVLASRPDLVSEGTGFLAIDPASADNNAVAVYRFFDTQTGGHFYTESGVERDSVLATRPDLKFEGTSFSEFATPQSGTTTVYRFFDLRTGGHFYTASGDERASILGTRPDLIAEGVAFYAPTGT